MENKEEFSYDDIDYKRLVNELNVILKHSFIEHRHRSDLRFGTLKPLLLKYETDGVQHYIKFADQIVWSNYLDDFPEADRWNQYAEMNIKNKGCTKRVIRNAIMSWCWTAIRTHGYRMNELEMLAHFKEEKEEKESESPTLDYIKEIKEKVLEQGGPDTISFMEVEKNKDTKELAELLGMLGFTCIVGGSKIRIEFPSYRENHKNTKNKYPKDKFGGKKL